ncbi:IPExxxVDY family protein [Mesonia maritima]|uniref:IPExxxVDY family protein n=1 Tax=Mesonia maritima TaxID=1793873 RepID=A0ABU1K4C9_9FLAO|nr:IPExxxVDY family protein [Mesonia maritima]MDR6299877.1 hypothetical protein [Mesonia maritima]
MAVNKLMLDGFAEDDYKLIAIHSSIEAYKLAFFLNKTLSIKLEREVYDVDFSHKEGIAYYQLFSYLNENLCCNYYLVSNKYKLNPEEVIVSNGLFPEEGKVNTNLIYEYKSVDFFLKIEDDTDSVSLKKLLININKIQQVVTAYSIEVSTLKSNKNLIFN